MFREKRPNAIAEKKIHQKIDNVLMLQLGTLLIIATNRSSILFLCDVFKLNEKGSNLRPSYAITSFVHNSQNNTFSTLSLRSEIGAGERIRAVSKYVKVFRVNIRYRQGGEHEATFRIC